MTAYAFPPNVSRHLPEPLALALVGAAQSKDIERIDELTDAAAVQGLVRRRDDMSRAAEWQRRRDARALAAAMGVDSVFKA